MQKLALLEVKVSAEQAITLISDFTRVFNSLQSIDPQLVIASVNIDGSKPGWRNKQNQSYQHVEQAITNDGLKRKNSAHTSFERRRQDNKRLYIVKLHPSCSPRYLKVQGGHHMPLTLTYNFLSKPSARVARALVGRIISLEKQGLEIVTHLQSTDTLACYI